MNYNKLPQEIEAYLMEEYYYIIYFITKKEQKYQVEVNLPCRIYIYQLKLFTNSLVDLYSALYKKLPQ